MGWLSSLLVKPVATAKALLLSSCLSRNLFRSSLWSSITHLCYIVKLFALYGKRMVGESKRAIQRDKARKRKTEIEGEKKGESEKDVKREKERFP